MKIRKIKIKKPRKPNSMPFRAFRRDHLPSTWWINCGSESFSVQFGDHLPSGDHLRSEIIYGAVHVCLKT